LAAFCGFAKGHSVQKSVSMETLKPHDAMNCPRSREFPTPVQSLAAHSKAMHGTGTAGLARNPAPCEVLNLALRFTQNSNINSADGCCGELKARVSGDFPCGKTKVFPWRRCGGGFRRQKRASDHLMRKKFLILGATRKN
jgi:hypothetical protein